MIVIQRLNPRIDIAFKKIFGVEENKDLLISLINAIVDPADHVSEITLLNPYNVQNFKTDKMSVLDIKAKNSEGKQFNIEMQITDEGDYSQRALYYWSKMYAAQISAGETYTQLCKTIGIHILYFSSIQDADYHHVFHIHDKKTKNHHFDDFELHTLELPKFASKNEQLTDLVKKIKTSLDIWMAFLTRNDLLVQNQLPPALDDKYLNKAINVLDVMNLNAIEREVYENREKYFMIMASALEHRFNKGKEAGLAEGEEKGKAEGLAEGAEKGKAEGLAEGALQAKCDVAMKLLAHNISDDIILASSGLTLSQLNALKSTKS